MNCLAQCFLVDEADKTLSFLSLETSTLSKPGSLEIINSQIRMWKTISVQRCSTIQERRKIQRRLKWGHTDRFRKLWECCTSLYVKLHSITSIFYNLFKRMKNDFKDHMFLRKVWTMQRQNKWCRISTVQLLVKIEFEKNFSDSTLPKL